MTGPQTPEPLAPRSRPQLWALVTFGFAFLFLLSEQNFTVDVGELEDYAPSAEEASEQASGGSLVRKVMFPMLGLAGALLLFAAPKQKTRWNRSFLLVLGLLLAWATASLGWSIAPSQTIKRLVILYCCVVCLVGYCRTFGPGDLLRMVFVISLLFVGSSLLIEIVVRRDNPLAGGYRFAGGVHPNSQAGYCAALMISSFFLAWDSRRLSLFALATSAVALFLLFMTKSRTSLAGGVLAVGLPFSMLLPPKHRALAATGVAFALLSALGASALLVSDASSLSSAATLGREDNFISLNGRVPLWTFMLEHYIWGVRWMVGSGYDAIWSPNRIEIISFNLDWSVPNSHSVYIDTLLSLGLVGLLLAGLLVLIGLTSIFRQYTRFRHPQIAAVAGLATFAFTNSFLESSYVQPTSFESFTTAAAVLMVAGFGAKPQAGSGKLG